MVFLVFLVSLRGESLGSADGILWAGIIADRYGVVTGIAFIMFDDMQATCDEIRHDAALLPEHDSLICINSTDARGYAVMDSWPRKGLRV